MILKVVNTAASFLNEGIDAVTGYVKENGMAIVILLTIVYFVRSQYSSGTTSTGYVLSQDSGTSTGTVNGGSNSRDTKSKEEEMRQVRLRQQEVANQRAIEAEKIRKKKEAEERERKNHVAKKKPPTTGDRLGGDDTNSSTKKSKIKKSSDSGSGGVYHPLQPLASHTSGYRPPRRTPRA